MTVKTKFSIGQKVYAMHEGRIGAFFVQNINIRASQDNGINVTYGFHDQVGDYVAENESNLFASEQQLVKHLLKQYKEDYQ